MLREWAAMRGGDCRLRGGGCTPRVCRYRCSTGEWVCRLGLELTLSCSDQLGFGLELPNAPLSMGYVTGCSAYHCTEAAAVQIIASETSG